MEKAAVVVRVAIHRVLMVPCYRFCLKLVSAHFLLFFGSAQSKVFLTHYQNAKKERNTSERRFAELATANQSQVREVCAFCCSFVRLGLRLCECRSSFAS
jgi:hypothetical protein